MKHQIFLNKHIFLWSIFFLFPNTFLYTKSQNNQKKEQILAKKIDQNSDENVLDVIEEEEQLALDDERLMKEILEIISFSYTELIDLSALYFCGIVNWDKLSDQIIMICNKDFFKILKLFSWYVPAVLKNPKISHWIKFKKLGYIAICIVLFWYISKEIFQEKNQHKGIKFDGNDILMGHRQHPYLNL